VLARAAGRGQAGMDRVAVLERTSNPGEAFPGKDQGETTEFAETNVLIV